MDEIQRLKALVAKLQNEAATIKGQMEAAAGKGEDGKDELSVATKAFQSKQSEITTALDDLEKAIADAKVVARTKALVDEAEGLTSAVAPDGAKGGIAAGETPGEEGGDENAPDGDKAFTRSGAPAEAVDHVKRLDAMENVFMKFMGADEGEGGRLGAISGNEQTLLRPQSKSLRARCGNGEEQVIVPPRMYAKMLKADVAAMEKAVPMKSSDGSSAGGRSYLFWPEYHETLEYLPPTNPSFYDRVRKIGIVGEELKIPKGDQSTSEYMGVATTRYTEGNTPDDTEANFSQKTIKAYPLGAYSTITNIMLHRDRVGLENLLVDLFGMALRNTIDTEIASGSGDTSNECLGILSDDDVTTVARATANQISYNDLIDLEYELPDRVLDNFAPSYAVSRTGLKYLKEQTVSSDGTTDRRPLFSATTAGGLWDRLNTYGYFRGKNLSALGTAGDAVFGVWPLYWLAIEMEAVVTRSIHARFLQGETAYRIDTLVGGKALFPEAFAVLAAPSGS